MAILQSSLAVDLLRCATAADVLVHIEDHAIQYDAGAGSVALHVLAATARPKGADEARRLGATPAVGRLVMQLGAQLAGGSDLDARGLVALLWTLATLAPPDSPLLQGLAKRIILLAQRGRLTPGQLHISAQALAALGLTATGSIATGLAHALLPRLAAFNAAQLGDLLRVFAIPPPPPGTSANDGLSAPPQRAEGAIEALFREALSPLALSATFLEPLAPSASTSERNRLAAARQHGSATALVALAAADLDPPADSAAVGGLLTALNRAGFGPERLGMRALSELLWALRRLNKADEPLHGELLGALHALVAQATPEELEAAAVEVAAQGERMVPALLHLRERHATLAEQVRGLHHRFHLWEFVF